MKNSRYTKRLVILESLGFDYATFYDKLSVVYLVPQEEAEQIVSLMGNKKYKDIKNSQQLSFLFNCMALYGIQYFGSTPEEGKLLVAKRDSFSLLEKIFGGSDFDKTLLWKYGEVAFAKSIIGTVYYYGVDRTENKELGEKMLKEAAEQGDVDALLWCINMLPDKRKYMKKLMSLPEYLADPEWLEPIKAKYGIYDVQEQQAEKRKIGF